MIKARLAGAAPPAPFEYFDKGSMATIGYRAAVADAFGMKFTGIIAYIMWMFIHMLYLIGWGNRIGTVYTWLRALVFSKNRGHRIITFEQANTSIDEDTQAKSGTRAIMPHSHAESASAAKEEAANQPRQDSAPTRAPGT